jgi:hypothetical protein
MRENEKEKDGKLNVGKNEKEKERWKRKNDFCR